MVTKKHYDTFLEEFIDKGHKKVCIFVWYESQKVAD